MIKDYTRFNPGDAAHGVDFENLRHVLREIENDSDVAALSGERGAAAASEEWGAVITANRDRRENVFSVAGDDDSDGDLTVVGAVGCIENAAARVETNFSAEMAAEGGLERGGVHRLGARRQRAGGDVIVG
jgi:hypothetical protein